MRLGSALSKRVERDIKEFNYSTKTEFIREAIRDKLKENERERQWKALFAARGVLKGKGKFKSYEEWHDWRSNVYSKQLERELSEKYGLKP